jgi:hypothetical protein
MGNPKNGLTAIQTISRFALFRGLGRFRPTGPAHHNSSCSRVAPKSTAPVRSAHALWPQRPTAPTIRAAPESATARQCTRPVATAARRTTIRPAPESRPNPQRPSTAHMPCGHSGPPHPRFNLLPSRPPRPRFDLLPSRPLYHRACYTTGHMPCDPLLWPTAPTIRPAPESATARQCTRPVATAARCTHDSTCSRVSYYTIMLVRYSNSGTQAISEPLLYSSINAILYLYFLYLLYRY